MNSMGYHGVEIESKNDDVLDTHDDAPIITYL
jgi:hypothetical protein